MNNTQDRPLVSIITAVRNAKFTLARTIESVINQTYHNIEYIIIDGGSTDGSLDIIKSYQQKVAYWISEPDRGIADAWNKGIKACHGELLGIINADDWYNSDTVETIVQRYCLDRSIDIFHGDIFFSFPDNSTELVPACPDPRKLLVCMSLNHPTCFVKKSVYDTYGVFDTRYRISTDYELLLRSYMRGVKFCYINKVLAYMSVGGISDSGSYLSLKEVRDISVKYGYPGFKANIWFFCKVVVDRIFSNRKLLHKARRWMRRVLNS